MGITFRSVSVPGMVLPWEPGPWDFALQTHSQFGVAGSGIIWGERTGRRLAIPVWVINNYNSAATLRAKLTEIEGQAGKIGSVVETSGAGQTFNRCLLEHVERTGQLLPPNAHIGWSIEITLHLQQLQP